MSKNNLKARWYQDKAIQDTIEGNSYQTVIKLGTGLGKSFIISSLAEHYSKDEKVVVLTNIAALIDQLDAHLPDCSIIKAGKNRNNDSNITLIMEQSFNETRRPKHTDLIGATVIIDEALGFNGKRKEDIMRFLEPKREIILSGSPYDEKGVNLFPVAKFVAPITMLQAIEDGYLAPFKHYVPVWSTELDFSEVKMSGNDYSSESLNELMDSNWYKKNFIDWIKTIGLENRSTAIYCSNIDHAESIMKLMIDNEIGYEEPPEDDSTLFNEATKGKGISLACIHSKRDGKLNERYTKLFKEDKLRCIISVSSLTIGFDAPIMDTLINLRPTLIRRLFYQLIGRGSRTHPNKTHCDVFDLGNCLSEHGFPEIEYTAPNTKSEAKALKQKTQINDIVAVAKANPEEEITLHTLNEYRETIQFMKEDMTNKTVKELMQIYDAENDLYEIIKIGALIYSEINYAVKPSTVDWIIKEYETKLVRCISMSLVSKLVKKRIKTIIKENKKFGSIYYYITWLIEESWVKIEFSPEIVYEEVPKNDILKDFDIDEGEIPF